MTDIEYTYQNNQTKDVDLRLLCNSCSVETKHYVVQSYDRNGVEAIPEQSASVSYIDNFQIVRCKGCDTISFRHQIWSSDYTDGGYSDGIFEDLYPKRTEIDIERPYCAVKGLPRNLEIIYRETVDAYNFGLRTLCAGGLRALLEGICKNQNITSGQVKSKTTGIFEKRSNLEGKIEGMSQEGLITIGQSKILHGHRYLGNEALHDLQRPSTDELEVAIDIVEHILLGIYELPQKGKDFDLYTSKRKKSHDTTS